MDLFNYRIGIYPLIIFLFFACESGNTNETPEINDFYINNVAAFYADYNSTNYTLSVYMEFLDVLNNNTFGNIHLSHEMLTDNQILQDAGTSLEGATGFKPSSIHDDFITLVGGSFDPISAFAAEAYDAVAIMALAMHSANSSDPQVYKNHIDNLIKSLKKYGIKKKFIRRDILEIINRNISLRNNYNHLLRVALNNKIISISLRKRVSPKLNFHLKFINFKREKPKYKNLKYKKILSYLSKMDNSSSDVALVFNKKILETGTSNLLFVKNNKIFTPNKDYYEGNTYKFFKSKIKKIIKKDILIKELKNYDEILLVGSGKGVTSVKKINEINWKRKNLKKYKLLKRYYYSAIKRCSLYKF